MALIDNLVVFIVSLVIGALGIYIGASIMTDSDDYTYAIVTAVIASILWAVLSFIPFLGPILALIAYVALINYRYPGGWIDAIGIALVAWIASIIILYVLALFNIATFEAMGVPGV